MIRFFYSDDELLIFDLQLMEIDVLEVVALGGREIDLGMRRTDIFNQKVSENTNSFWNQKPVDDSHPIIPIPDASPAKIPHPNPSWTSIVLLSCGSPA